MTSFSSLRVRLVGTVFLAVVSALLVLFLVELMERRGTVLAEAAGLWPSFAVGFVALMAAWFGGERYIMRQVRLLSNAARGLAAGDLTSRTNLAREKGEFGELARTLDSMAASLQEKIKERERAEKVLLNRSFQQTVVSALGQFALVSNDFGALLNQSVMLVAQTLEMEYCGVLELRSQSNELVLRAGTGWREGSVGQPGGPAEVSNQLGFTLTAGEPVVVEDLQKENRFSGSSLLTQHGVVSGITVVISGHGKAYGILGAHTTNRRSFSEDEVHFLLAVATVLAMAVERSRAETQLQKLAAFAQLNPNPAMELAPDSTINYFNDAALELAFAAGHSHPSALLPSNIKELVSACLSKPETLRLETQASGRTLSWLFHPVGASQGVHAYVGDITDHKNLQAQLLQSQKMESVGQLAAGVAHDFNNMLTIIQGHAGMLLARTDLPPGMADSIQAIYFGSERAASLTRQLLMFSRKNVMQTKLLDLREVVFNLSKMLQRLLGETISLEFQGPEEIPAIKADIGMVEQVIMNLAVNARDAMPKGGTLTITTLAVEIGSVYVQTHPQARSGHFVCLRVKDTGFGMDEMTLARMYEPFFTTKEVGKGTGLGLATVYGIVKQHDGWIECDSAPGRGTTFRIFFPALQDGPELTPIQEPATTGEVQRGRETILIVEDEPVLRKMANLILTDAGYQILEAGNGVEAQTVFEEQGASIDLLLTDMVMPEGISGMDLATRLQAVKPDLKVIFASGYSMDDLDTSFLREGHATFLEKPYTHISLTKSVRDSLDQGK